VPWLLLLYEIEAIGHMAAYGIKNGWDQQDRQNET
jgi:hypothetical protein